MMSPYISVRYWFTRMLRKRLFTNKIIKIMKKSLFLMGLFALFISCKGNVSQTDKPQPVSYTHLVEYCLTERGLSLIPHIQGLVDWALQQMSGIMESRVLHTSWLALALIYQWAFSAKISASDRWVNLLSIQARTSNVFKSWRSYLSCSIFWMSFWYCSQRLFLAFSYDGSG